MENARYGAVLEDRYVVGDGLELDHSTQPTRRRAWRQHLRAHQPVEAHPQLAAEHELKASHGVAQPSCHGMRPPLLAVTAISV